MSDLVYVDNFTRGFTRRRSGEKWIYSTLAGIDVKSPRTIARLDAIGLPPAYANAWFCPNANGHIQAIAYDAKGRRQYRYHRAFQVQQDEAKYGRCLAFGHALPTIRKQIEQDLARRDMSHSRVVAAVVRLLDLGKVRVGNRAYAQANKSFGATTLRNRHAKVKGQRVELDYVGKSGKQQRISIEDRRLATVVRRCQEIPGQALFQYYDETGDRHPVSSADVNDYLRSHTGAFTAKDFRTWGASVIAYGALAESNGNIKLKELLGRVSAKLGNTPAIARKSYVHPAIIELAMEQRVGLRSWRLPRATRYLQPVERGMIAFLEDYASQTD
ncbi:MAG: DNA topoisomerase IB [Novosphingobium sp.]